MGNTPLKFFEMFNLTGSRMSAEPSPLISQMKYNQELFIAIFWEESFFRNMRQNSGWDSGRSVGFGQVQIANVNKFLGTTFKDPAAQILSSDSLSVDVALKAMLAADQWKRGDKQAALRGYGGGSAPNWLATSAALLKIPLIAQSATITAQDADSNKSAIIAALELTRRDAIVKQLF